VTSPTVDTKAPKVLAEREELARIIDPKAWRVRQERLDRAAHWLENPDKFRQAEADMFHRGNLSDADLAVKESRAKADEWLSRTDARNTELVAQRDGLVNAAIEAFAADVVAEAVRYARCYQPGTDGFNTFHLLADRIAALAKDRIIHPFRAAGGEA